MLSLGWILSGTGVAADIVVFDLSEHISNETFDLRPPLQQSGEPRFEVVNGALRLGNRSASWHALDLSRDFEAAPLQTGDIISIEGTIIDAPSGSTMVLGGAESPWNWTVHVDVEGTQEFILETTLTEQHFTDSQFVRLRLQTNEAGARSDFIVRNWTVTRDGTSPEVTHAPVEEGTSAAQTGVSAAPEVSAEPVLIYSLDTDSYIEAARGSTDLTDAVYLTRSGDPAVSVEGTELVLTNRSENWDTVDVLFEQLGLETGGTYLFTAEGTAPAGTEIGWHRSDAPWTFVHTLATTSAAGTWEIQAQITYPFVPTMPGLRIQTNAAPNADITVTSIQVHHVSSSDSAEASQFATPEWDLNLPALRELFEPYFLVGNIYSTTPIMDQFDTRDAFHHHFNAVTAENWHKPDQIAGPASRLTRPRPDEFTFTQADAIIEWAVENDITLAGHALVWHNQSPDWLFRSAPGVPLTRSEAIDNMEFYIRTIAEHWSRRGVRDSFYSWDVVNEAIASNGGTWNGDLDDWNAGDWRSQMRTDSGWWNAFANGYDASAGEHPSDFVFYAYYYARRYFPESILYYNDYNEEIPAKRNAIAQMVEQINERWRNHPEYDGRLLIERIGMQSHYHLRGWTTNIDNVRAALERFAATGAGIAVTELDVTVGGYGTDMPDPADLPALYEEQAEVYARLFGYYLEFAEDIDRVSFWGLADSQSWRAPGHPLLFDAQFRAKPSFHAIVDTVRTFSGAQ
ncbi:MAG: endo-1,4-beta-xylanase [Spirochaetaceae bacterium]